MLTLRPRLELFAGNLAATLAVAVATATALLLATEGFAQSSPHRDPVDQLVYQVRDLQIAVQEARFHYPVLSATDRLEHEARVLDHCVTYGDPDRRGRWGRSDGCRSELREVRIAFREVQSFLHDTRYQFPWVHRQYTEVQETLQRVENWFGYQPHPQPQPQPLPPPPPAYPVPPVAPYPLRATGSFENIRFDLRGDRVQIQHQCHSMAARMNILWVRAVHVNGRTYQDPYGRALHINDTCHYVAQAAY